jgi:hypothetical protein
MVNQPTVLALVVRKDFRSIIPITHAAIRTVGMISDTHGLEAFFCGNAALPMIHIAVTPITLEIVLILCFSRIET